MTREEFIALYDAQVSLVRSVLARTLRLDARHLDDLTQDVFLRAWKARETFRAEASPRTWVCRIARNAALDFAKSKREAPGDDNLLEAPGVSPHERVAVQQILATLEPEDRLLLTMACVEEFTMNECARVLEIPPGTAKSRLHSLRQLLRSVLETQELAS